MSDIGRSEREEVAAAFLPVVEAMADMADPARAWRKADIERLVEASSLGTPDAVAMRACTTPGRVQKVITRAHGGPCCDLHGVHCEAPSELCCWRCWEASHVGLFPHADGTPCVLDREGTNG